MWIVKNQETTIEKIIENLPLTIFSRAHKLNFITEASARSYLIKELSKTYLRKKILNPLNILLKSLNNIH